MPCPEGCGSCCKNDSPILLNEDIEIIESHDYIRKDFVLNKYDGLIKIIKRVNNDCMFLDEDCKCGIYSFRPLSCKTVPLRYNFKEGIVVEGCKDFWSDKEIKVMGVQSKQLIERIIEEAPEYENGLAIIKKYSYNLFSDGLLDFVWLIVKLKGIYPKKVSL